MSSVTIFWEIVQPLSPISLWPCQLQKALREHSLRVGMLTNRLWLKFASLLATLVSWGYYSIILETTKNKTLGLHAGWFFFFFMQVDFIWHLLFYSGLFSWRIGFPHSWICNQKIESIPMEPKSVICVDWQSLWIMFFFCLPVHIGGLLFRGSVYIRNNCT